MFVKYRCNGCPIDGQVDVPERGDLDMLEWMEQVLQLIANHHLAITGENHGTSDVAIPYDSNLPIGEISQETEAKADMTPFPAAISDK